MFVLKEKRLWVLVCVSFTAHYSLHEFEYISEVCELCDLQGFEKWMGVANCFLVFNAETVLSSCVIWMHDPI